MATSVTNPGVTSSVVAGTTSTTAAAGTSSSSTTGIDDGTIAGNFQTFLTLLTTQLQNQNPLDPMDTNQFTEQLVQFAQVEQQLKSNDQLSTLVSLQQTAQQTQALQFVGSTVAVDGSSTQLTNGEATWSFNAPKPASAVFTVTNSTGQTVYTGNYTVQAGQQDFTWNGQGNNGTQWPDGTYKMAITATDATGQNVGVSTQVEGVVDSVDMTQSPMQLSIGGQNYTLNQIQRIIARSS